MTTYNTGNPVPSADPRDRYDNSQSFDGAITGQELTFTDRLGVERKSWAGIEQDATDRLAELGYSVVGDYGDGLEISDYGQVFRKDGEFYRAAAGLDLPYTITGDWPAEAANFVSVGDAVLRGDLANPEQGAVIIGRGVVSVDTVSDLLSLPASARRDDLRYLVKERSTIAPFGGGDFYWDSASTAPADGVRVLQVSGQPAGRFLRVSKAGEQVKTWDVSTLETPRQRYSSEELLSMAEVFEAYALLAAPSGTNRSIEILAPIDNTKNIEAYIYGEFDATPAAVSTSGLHCICGQADTIDRSGFSTVASTVERVLPGLVKLTVQAANLTKNFAAVSIRTSNTESAKVVRLEMYQGGVLVARSLFDLMPPSRDWAGASQYTKVVSAGGVSVRHFIQIDAQNLAGGFVSSHYARVEVGGSSNLLKPPYNWNFFTQSVYPANPVRRLIVGPGEHKVYRSNFGINQAGDLAIIAPYGRASLMGGPEIKSSTWQFIQESPRFVISAPYSVDGNPDAAVRGGTRQPFVSVRVPENKTKSLLHYQLNPVADIDAVLSNDYSVFYDHATQTLYASFDAYNDNAYIYVCEVTVVVNMGDIPRDLFMWGVDGYAAKNDVISARPTAYTARRNGGKYVAIHNCGAFASVAGNGIRADNVDHEFVNCRANSNAFDGLNAHYSGISFIKGGEVTHNGDDGVSHHEQQIGWCEGLSSRHNAAGSFTPAFGATVYHRDCESVAPDNIGPKGYSGQMTTLSGQGGNTKSWWENCRFDPRNSGKTPYYANSQQSGTTVDVVVVKPVGTELTANVLTKSGNSDDIKARFE